MEPSAVPQPREVEGTLIVRSTAPDEVTRRIADLTGVAGYDLRPCPARRLHDAYLDTPEGALRRRHIGLRLRDLDGEALLALKADAHVTDLVSDRLEIESAWSEAALTAVRDELARRGVEVPPAAVAGRPAVEVLREAGLVPVQHRETTRLPREVIASGGEPVAEVAVDSVLYHLDGREVRLHEVEVEARAPGNAGTVQAVVRGLAEAFPAELEPWPHGKLATGEALRALLAEGGLEGLIGDDGTLAEEAFDVLARRLERSGRA